MRATVFIPNGEVRVPKEGEWCRTKNGEIRTIGPHDMFQMEYEIGVMHELEIPLTAYHMAVRWPGTLNPPIVLPVPMQKRKVKKWQWVMRWNVGGRMWMTDGHYTHEEATAATPPEATLIARVEQTMIEWDEVSDEFE